MRGSHAHADLHEPPEALETGATPAGADRELSLRRIAIVPAYNEAGSIDTVIDEIRRVDPDLEIVVVDDGSRDDTSALARRAGAMVLRLPFNLGIGGAVQAGYVYARERGFQIAVQVDGDGQHDPAEIPKLLQPLLEDRADMVVGSRFLDDNAYRSSLARRVGIALFARLVSLLVRQRVTDTTSGFRAVNRKGILLFSADYPSDYPEVESMVLLNRHELRMVEVPVEMRDRVVGKSSITFVRSVYYVVKVTLALFIGMFRRRAAFPEE